MIGIRRGQNNKGRARLLVTITVYGSAGPLRFLVHEGEVVAVVVRKALKVYARQGRLPILGSCLDEFVLYHANGAYEAMGHKEKISFNGERNFLLCKQQREASEEKVQSMNSVKSVGKKGIVKSISSSWKSGMNKVLSFRI